MPPGIAPAQFAHAQETVRPARLGTVAPRIAIEQIGALDPDLAGFAVGQVAPRRVAHPQADARIGPPDRAVRRGPVGQRDEAGFARAVEKVKRGARKRRPNGGPRRGVQDPAADHHMPDPRRATLPLGRGVEQAQLRGRGIDQSRTRGAQLPELCVGPRRGDQMRCRAQMQRRDHAIQRQRMMQRADHRDAVPRRDPPQVAIDIEARDPRGLAAADPLREAGRPRGLALQEGSTGGSRLRHAGGVVEAELASPVQRGQQTGRRGRGRTRRDEVHGPGRPGRPGGGRFGDQGAVDDQPRRGMATEAWQHRVGRRGSVQRRLRRYLCLGLP